jgi:hypothetical protein
MKLIKAINKKTGEGSLPYTSLKHLCSDYSLPYHSIKRLKFPFSFGEYDFVKYTPKDEVVRYRYSLPK